MLGDEGHFELRDLAALYLHAGDLPAAVTHLSAYAKCSAAQGKGHVTCVGWHSLAASTMPVCDGDITNASPHSTSKNILCNTRYFLIAAVTEVYMTADSPKEERDIIERMQERLEAIPELADMAPAPLLTLHSALRVPRPVADAERRTPLTW